MHFFSSVNTEHYVAHLFVHKLLYLIIQKHTVGCQCKTEILVVDLLLLTSVSNQILYYLPVHKRLSTEEIHFQISSVTGVRNEEIQCFLSYLIAHEGTASMVLALLCKAVATGQVAVMGNVQTQRLHDRLLGSYNIVNIVFINILCIQLSFLDQLVKILSCLPDILLRVLVLQEIHGLLQSLFLIIRDHIINQIIHHMDGSAVHIQQDVITIIFILVNHCFSVPLSNSNSIRKISSDGSRCLLVNSTFPYL